MVSFGTDLAIENLGYEFPVASAFEEPTGQPAQAEKKEQPSDTVSVSTAGRRASAKDLSEDEERQVAELKTRDREVRAHEAAHMGAGGGVVRGGASYTFQAGPDGRRYAVGGEVSIDASPVKDNPEATIRKMQQVRSAALAPANPSGQDRSVAAAAAAQEASARMQLREETREERTEEVAPENGSAHQKQQNAAGYSAQGENVPFPDNGIPQIDLSA